MNRTKRLLQIAIAISVIALAGCKAEKDVVTLTPEPPIDTRVPSTATPIPPTDTPVLPTDTPPPPSDTPFPVTDAPALPTEEFTRTTTGGDGYVAHVPISEVEQKSHEEIVTILVTQWLEHYKTESSQLDAKLKDYKIDEISIISDAEDISPFIIASVSFSVIPVQIPNMWRCREMDINEPWCHSGLRFGVYGKVTGPYYWLRIMVVG